MKIILTLFSIICGIYLSHLVDNYRSLPEGYSLDKTISIFCGIIVVAMVIFLTLLYRRV